MSFHENSYSDFVTAMVTLAPAVHTALLRATTDPHMTTGAVNVNLGGLVQDLVLRSVTPNLGVEINSVLLTFDIKYTTTHEDL